MSKCLMGPKFITEVNGETGPSINLTPDKVGGLSEYICTTAGTNHELTGSGNNIKFIADANYSEGNTITVNGKTVTAKLQNGEALSSDAWVAGAVVTCFLNGDTLNFKGGGGLSAADKAKFIPKNIRKDVVLFAGTPREVVGNLFPSDEHNCLAASWNKVYDVNNAPMMANNITDDSPISVTANTITVKRDFKAYIYKKGWCYPTNVTRFMGTSNIPTGQQSFTTGESFNINLPCEHGYNQTSGILIIFAVNG